MMKYHIRIVISLLFVVFFVSTPAVWGQDIKTRMHDRLPVIVALKAEGVIGENNQGFLTIRQGTDKKAVVDAENQDRQTIYAAIAKKQNTTAELVGQRRALQIAEKAETGTWIQDSKGKWVQK